MSPPPFPGPPPADVPAGGNILDPDWLLPVGDTPGVTLSYGLALPAPCPTPTALRPLLAADALPPAWKSLEEPVPVAPGCSPRPNPPPAPPPSPLVGMGDVGRGGEQVVTAHVEGATRGKDR